MSRSAVSNFIPAMSSNSGGGAQQTITIINNSGKVISTGKQLVSLFKEVSNTYKDKKTEIKLKRFLQRSSTDAPPRDAVQTREYEPSAPPSKTQSVYRQEGDERSEYRIEDDRRSRRTFDEQSVATSRRSHKSRHSTRSAVPRSKPDALALTEDNLERLTEVSSVAPSKAPGAYRSPYAETLQAGVVSKANLTEYRAPTEYDQSIAETAREHSEPEYSLQPYQRAPAVQAASASDDDDDMHLAYGGFHADLEHRRDLGPVVPEEQVAEAQSLVHKIENLLDEMECVEHTATAMIKHLQERPDAAAAVALALAKLSTFVDGFSPSILNMLRGASPAVFALLASPQFLIGTGIAVGVTVVMFGGWKIVQRAQQEQRKAMAFEAAPMAPAAAAAVPARPPSEVVSNGVDEALVLEQMEEELSTIETWRRGIVVEKDWEKETAELELITPKANKVRRSSNRDRDGGDFDTRSHRSAHTHQSTKHHKSHKSSASSVYKHKEGHHHNHSHSHSHSQSHSHSHSHHHHSSSEKKSRRNDDGASVASSSVSEKSTRKLKAIEDGSSKNDELPFKPKKPNMLKTLFKRKEKEKQAEVVYAS